MIKLDLHKEVIKYEKISVVGAVILNKDNEVLCALRSTTMPLPNYWGFPGRKRSTPEQTL